MGAPLPRGAGSAPAALALAFDALLSLFFFLLAQATLGGSLRTRRIELDLATARMHVEQQGQYLGGGPRNSKDTAQPLQYRRPGPYRARAQVSVRTTPAIAIEPFCPQIPLHMCAPNGPPPPRRHILRFSAQAGVSVAPSPADVGGGPGPDNTPPGSGAPGAPEGAVMSGGAPPPPPGGTAQRPPGGAPPPPPPSQPPGQQQQQQGLGAGYTQEQMQRIMQVPLSPEIQQAIDAARGAFFAEVGQAWQRSLLPLEFSLKSIMVEASQAIQQAQAQAQSARSAQESQSAEQVRQVEAERKARREAKRAAAASPAPPSRPPRKKRK